MLLGRLFTVLIVTISFVDVTSAIICVCTEFVICVVFVGRQLSYRNDQTWYCSQNEKCGTTYNSCIPDPPLQMSSAEAVIGVLVLFVWFGLAFLSCWCRYNRRKQAEKRFIRRVQTAVAEVQQPRTVYLVVDPPAASVPLTNEQPPPSYEHIQK